MIPSEVKAFQEEKLRELAERPNTQVLRPKFTVHKAWKADRLRGVMEKLVARVVSADKDMPDFTLRKACLEDTEILTFQRQHPKCFWLLTDRSIIKDEKSRNAITGMLLLKEKMERGELTEDDANAAATKHVMESLQ